MIACTKFYFECLHPLPELLTCALSSKKITRREGALVTGPSSVAPTDVDKTDFVLV